jgi:hypothetical protein
MVTTLILFLLINGYFIILCLFSYGFALQLGGAVEILPRVLVVLKLALMTVSHYYQEEF